MPDRPLGSLGAVVTSSASEPVTSCRPGPAPQRHESSHRCTVTSHRQRLPTHDTTQHLADVVSWVAHRHRHHATIRSPLVQAALDL
jgi:hypothetical protein